MKTLIVYYSLEGNTEYVVNRIAKRIGADTLRLVPVKEYSDKGPGKFVWGGKSVIMREMPELEPYDINMRKYNRVIIGFPVWASSFAPPIRTFVADNRKMLKRKELYAFATQGGRGAEKALEKLRKLIGIRYFEEEAVFVEPKKRHSKETDEAIDLFCEEFLELNADKEGLKDSKGAKAVRVVRGVKAVKNLKNSKGSKVLNGVKAVKGVKAAKELKDSRKHRTGNQAREYFSHWNYKKHAKLCVGVYLVMFLFDMTVSYFICKKLLDKVDERTGR